MSFIRCHNCEGKYFHFEETRTVRHTVAVDPGDPYIEHNPANDLVEASYSTTVQCTRCGVSLPHDDAVRVITAWAYEQSNAQSWNELETRLMERLQRER